MLDSKLSRCSKICANMVYHAIALGNGHKYFWSLVNTDCSSAKWQTRSDKTLISMNSSICNQDKLY